MEFGTGYPILRNWVPGTELPHRFPPPLRLHLLWNSHSMTGFSDVIRAMELHDKLSAELGLKTGQVVAALALFEGGATVPFIARYRKEATDNLDETQLRALAARHAYYTELEARRETVLNSIREQGKLTPELEARIRAVTLKTELEDLYLPYKPKRATRASKAREAGLEPLARWLFDLAALEADLAGEAAKYAAPDKGFETAEAALKGACDILAEEWSEDADARKELRGIAAKDGAFTSSVRPEFEGQKIKFEMYRDFREAVGAIPSHRLLAMFRGEREKVLKVGLEIPKDKAVRSLVFRFIRHPRSAAAGLLLETVVDALDRLLAPATETEIRKSVRRKAEAEAISVFAENLRDLLLSPPAGRKAVLGIDPGIRTGCKIAAVDPTGKFLEYRPIFPFEPKNDIDGAKLALDEMICDNKIELVAVGNGTAGRDAERVVRTALEELPEAKRPPVVMVSEAGASVYSASENAIREFPKLDITVRGAISIARRLQDPLAELVKIEPRSIGVGQYQHDVDQGDLKASLDAVVETCVNKVGVDANLASIELLKYVAGLNRATAAAIVRHRHERGPFRSREALKEVKGLGEKTFEQAAGFLRIPGAMNPLDNSAVHPERYDLVERIAQALGATVRDLVGNKALLDTVDPQAFVGDGIGRPTVEDILRELEKPGRDPRAEFRYASFSEGAREIGHLEIGMVLEGVVSNVANFGAFVDIGVHQDGLVHVSELADRFVTDPRTVVKVGQVVKVKVIKLDADMRRIGLSMKQSK